MRQRISLKGSAFLDTDPLERHQQVAFLVYGEVKDTIQTGNQSLGDFDAAVVTVSGMVRMVGVEGREAIDRVKAELDAADAATVNGGPGES